MEPTLALARHAAREKGNVGAVLSGANEAAVALFLEDRIRFCEIAERVGEAVARIPALREVTVDDVIESDRAARALVREIGTL